MALANRENRVATNRFFRLLLIRVLSPMPTPNPTPMIGPISGLINMAPIMTAVEFMFNPSDAMKMAQINTHRLVPLNCVPLVIASMISALDCLSLLKLRYSLVLPLIFVISNLLLPLIVYVGEFTGILCDDKTFFAIFTLMILKTVAMFHFFGGKSVFF